MGIIPKVLVLFCPGSATFLMQTTPFPTLRHQPKVQEVCVRLTDMAHLLGPDNKFPTVVELRDELGVSMATLNNALKVLEANQIIYRIQGIGVFASPSLQRHVSLVCAPDFFQQVGASPFWPMMIANARDRAQAKSEAFSYHFSLPGGHEGTPLHAGLVREIESRNLHGLLGIGLDNSTATWIEERNIPFVAFAGPAKWMVALDSRALIALGVEELANQGCKRIAYWNPGLPTQRSKTIVGESEKNTVWRKSLAKRGLEVDEQLLHNRGIEPAVGQSHQEQGFHLAHEVFSRPRSSWPDGILSGDDVMTHGALVAMDKLGVAIGRDVRIASHANRNSPVLMGCEDVLTRLEYNPEEVVRAMFDSLEALMDGEEPSQPIVYIRPVVR